MALTVSNLKFQSAGSELKRTGTLAFDSSYPTGGEALTATSLALSAINRLFVYPYNGYIFQTVNTTPYSVNVKVGTGGVGTVEDNYAQGDIKGSINTASPNTDAASLPTNGALMLAATTFTVLAGTMTPTTQPDIARNIGIFITNDSGGALDLFEGVTTFAVTGVYKGDAQTESITLTSTAGNKSVANTKFRYVYGTKPFDSVTSVAITNAPAGALKGSIGPGSKLALPNPLLTPAESDVTKITKNAANLSPTGIVDTTYYTVNFGTLADGDDIAVTYKVAGSEVPSGKDLSALSAVEFEAYGY